MVSTIALLPSKQNTKHDLFSRDKQAKHSLLLQDKQARNIIYLIIH